MKRPASPAGRFHLIRPVQVGKLISGGQTGVDRAALDTALALGIEYGGWCPRGGWAEDLPAAPGLLAVYSELRETPSADPEERTARNVRDGDVTLVLRGGSAVSPGTDRTEQLAAELGRPLAVLDVDDASRDAAERLHAVLDTLPSQATLNVAGPRESEAPGIYAGARMLLEAILRDCAARTRQSGGGAETGVARLGAKRASRR